MARPLAPFSTYHVSPGGTVTNDSGQTMGSLDDYLGGVNDPQRAKDLRAESRAQGKYAPGPDGKDESKEKKR